MGLFNKIKNLFHKDTDNKSGDNPMPPFDLDLDNIRLQERMSFEWEAIQMRKEPLRIVGFPEYKLSDLLHKVGIDFENCKINICYSITDDWSGKNFHKINDINTYSVFEDYISKNSDGDWDTNGLSRSVMVFIGFVQDGKNGCVVAHMHPWGHRGQNMSIMARLSIMKFKSGEVKADVSKALAVFDITDPNSTLNKIEDYRKSAMKKLHEGVELNVLEACSINRQDTIGSYRGMAEMKMNHQRWGDAASDLIEAYRWLKPSVLFSDDRKAFFDVCYQLGQCYYNRGLYVKAAFYFELLSFWESESAYKAHYIDCLKTINDIRVGKKGENAKIKESTILNELLESIFDVLPDEVSALICVDNTTGEYDRIVDQIQIWNLDIKKLLNDKSNVSLFITFRSLGEKSKCIDKSKCRVDNNIIINLTRDDKVGTMSIMVPAFQLSNNNNKNNPQSVTVRFALTELLSERDFLAIRNTALNKCNANVQPNEIECDALGLNGEAHRLFIQGKIAFKNKLWGDVILYLTKAYRMLSSTWNSDKFDEFGRRIFGAVCYMLGFTYSELQQYEYSIYYLGIISGVGDIGWAGEYVNSLTNSKDVRALGFVNYEMQRLKDGYYDNTSNVNDRALHLSFLKRRLGYLLIETGRIKEAKEFLIGLLCDPNCSKFAKEELDYIAKTFPDA